MCDYKNQLERVKRFLSRIENQNRNQTEYDDDIWVFFQNCWHLKDWIKNDTSLPITARSRVENEVKNYESIMISADLANRSKHYFLRPNSRRVNADVAGVGVTIHHQTLHLNRKTGETSGGQCTSEYKYKITTCSNSEFEGIEIARKCVEDWEKVISLLGI